ncbi:hypothetical protein EDB81DRAFT_832624 [Dactylonectria macrodidyma]|uniref:Uncharacterized protein n=1 Tax=Dactylonectria macrodidyma TaxID=307937 RepID=A0A9P9D0G5_9HYPO|nr:hypothetical protein EDB81DRAFT_832624 [Dactylonectria macrodidyma]
MILRLYICLGLVIQILAFHLIPISRFFFGVADLCGMKTPLSSLSAPTSQTQANPEARGPAPIPLICARKLEILVSLGHDPEPGIEPETCRIAIIV